MNILLLIKKYEMIISSQFRKVINSFNAPELRRLPMEF